MLYRRLGTTDLDVSVICLGSMTWGVQNSETEAHAQLDRAVDAHGINFIDTAETYPVPPTAATQGTTERHIGTWLKARPGRRDKVIIATKVAGMNNVPPHIRDGKGSLDRQAIMAAIDGSLKRLQTDYVDLYQTHSPDRATNVFSRQDYVHVPEKDGVPIEETLRTLEELVKSGKVRHIGVSNETPWGLARHLALADHEGAPRVQSIQNPYNLLNRIFEIGLAEIAIRERCGLLAYSPLAMGVLSGKYLDGAKPAGARLTLFQRFQRHNKPRQEPATRAYVQLAREAGLDPVQMALAFVNTRDFVTSNIIGATTLEQLDTNARSIDVRLPADVLSRIEAIHAQNPNPCP
ncbi:MAG: NADP(H)-dependent aldo-keto reductase [Alphaproteobacteria bacterium]|nr:NADP(H)-dependent aldo-keto reductase [Alphaproteobacteria bacterium]